mmetsp:Transcript_7038/g.6177  ORF Transcript_7038/g.6177 Transcript_7038/m.6177 type:complete len:122 (-) Transcript_7038:291-656(-)
MTAFKDENDNLMYHTLNPIKSLPWMKDERKLVRKTLKIEVTFQEELILLRFIHMDKLYPLKFPHIMLEIINNFSQNQQIIERENLAAPDLKEEGIIVECPTAPPQEIVSEVRHYMIKPFRT